MKKTRILFTVIALLCFYPPNTYAQASEPMKAPEKALTHEISVNATRFLQQVMFSPVVSTGSPYVVQYKLFNSKMWGLRTGIGGNIANSSSSPNQIKVKTSQKSGDLRIGYEFGIPLTTRWGAYAGADGIVSWSEQKSTVTTTDFFLGEVETTTTTTAFGYGGGPVLGIRFHINDRISLFTEAMLYATQRTTTSKTTGSLFPLGSAEENTALNLDFQTPLSIFFAFNF